MGRYILILAVLLAGVSVFVFRDTGVEEVETQKFGVASTFTINDDAAQTITGGPVSLSDSTNQFGSFSVYKSFIGYRVTNVTIPNASTIQHAYIKVYLSTITANSNNDPLVNIENSDNSSAFTTAINDISSRSRTAGISPTISDLPNGYRVYDVTSLVQTVVNRAGWVSGNAMTFIFDSPDSSTVAIFSMVESSNDPEFGVIYSGSSDSIRSPSVSGTGSFTSPDNGFSSNGSYATTVNLGSVSQVYESFNIASLAGATIQGVLVQVEGRFSSNSNKSEYTVALSWDGGTTWTTEKRGFQFPNQIQADETYLYGGADQWSHSFVPSELTNTNFKVRVTQDVTTGNDAFLDWVSAQVFYAPATPLTPAAVQQQSDIVFFD